MLVLMALVVALHAALDPAARRTVGDLRAMAGAISDIAAMGGAVIGATISLALAEKRFTSTTIGTDRSSARSGEASNFRVTTPPRPPGHRSSHTGPPPKRPLQYSTDGCDEMLAYYKQRDRPNEAAHLQGWF